jgi:hypothetical protein
MGYVWLVLAVIALVQSVLLLLAGYYFGDWLEFSSRQDDPPTVADPVMVLPSSSPASAGTRQLPDSAVEGVVPVSEVVITFIDVPAAIHFGQNFIVRFGVQAPPGAIGQDAALLFTQSVRKDEDGVVVNSVETSRQSFGSFAPPKIFQSELHAGSVGDRIELEAFALVDGTLYSKQLTIPLIP